MLKLKMKFKPFPLVILGILSTSIVIARSPDDLDLGLFREPLGNQIEPLSRNSIHPNEIDVDDVKVQAAAVDKISGAVKSTLADLKSAPETVIPPIVGRYFVPFFRPSVNDLGYSDKQIIETVVGVFKNKMFTEVVDSLDKAWTEFERTEGGKEILVSLSKFIYEEDYFARQDALQEITDKFWGSINLAMMETFLDFASPRVVTAHTFIRSLLDDPMNIWMANAFLASQSMPILNPSDIIDSSMAVADASVKKFTPWKLDILSYQDIVNKHMTDLEKDYIRYNVFAKSSAAEQKIVVSRMLKENLIEPFQYLWLTHGNFLECLDFNLCSMRQHVRQNKSSNLRIRITDTMAAVYSTKMKADKFKIDWTFLWEPLHDVPDCSRLQKSFCRQIPWDRHSTKVIHNEL